MNDPLDKEIKKGNCVPGINYISVFNDDKSQDIFEVYLKNEDEYKIVGIWHHSGNKLPKYSKIIYKELKRQGMNEAGSLYISLEVKNKKECEEMMNYLDSIKNEQVSYTEVWEAKNKIVRYDFKKVNRIKYIEKKEGEND